MAARGWYSGDTHFHYARPSPEANEPLVLFMQAEDLRMGNILRMGDGRQPTSSNMASGRRGGLCLPVLRSSRGRRIQDRDHGHMIGLNLRSPIRNLERGYYVYGDVFDDIHREGGLAGYAHVTKYSTSSGAYQISRSISLAISRTLRRFVKTAMWRPKFTMTF